MSLTRADSGKPVTETEFNRTLSAAWLAGEAERGGLLVFCWPSPLALNEMGEDELQPS